MACAQPLTFFIEFHLPAPVVDYIQTFTTRPVDTLAKDFLADALAEGLTLLLPVPSRIIIGCFSISTTDSITVVFSVSASNLTASVLDSFLKVLIVDWITHLSLIRAPNLPLRDPPPLDVSILTQTSLILLPSEESHFSAAI
ncbi:ORF1 [Bovine adenovirus 3]|uniref:ORF1 n=1 Tax=Bovine adenovirus B serotype 3 TaxID=10510 RepID=A0A9W3NKE2_ADEB3|nr:ORF1 [Bovine adenovirus 3]